MPPAPLPPISPQWLRGRSSGSVGGNAELLAFARFHRAAASEVPEEVRNLLDADALLAHASDCEGRTALHVAAGAGALEVTRLLLESRADIAAVDHWGGTPLARAVSGGHAQVEQLLRDKGAVVQQAHLQQRAAQEGWEIPLGDLKLGKSISATFKSNLFLASWRGTTVVAKMPKMGKEPAGPVAETLGARSSASASRLLEDLESGRSVGSPSLLDVPNASPASSTSLPKVRESRSLLGKANARRASEASNDTQEVRQLSDDHSDQKPEESRQELLREIELMASFRHPDLVTFMGASLEDVPVCVMAYLPGGDLERHYKAKSKKAEGMPYKPALAQVLGWGAAVARALWYLHDRRQPVVHRDLKPLNVLLTLDLQAKVTDFGMARRMVGRLSDGGKMSGGVGSWRYMAPEVVRYKPYDEKADIYSFALLLFFMGSGRIPFYDLQSRQEDACLKEYLKGNEPRPDARECPAVLQPIIKDAWHKSPDERPPASELARRLAPAEGKGDGTCALL